MDRFHEIEVFLAVADSGSFAKAAVRLRLSPPAITRAVTALEQRLGARVFQRTTRRVSITEVGQRFLVNARRLVAELDAAQRDAVGEAAVPQGTLALTASVTFGRKVLAPLVLGFIDAHPRVAVTLLLVDRVVNLVEEGIDAAVRIGVLPESSLIARRVGSVSRLWVASPKYLAKHGTPSTPSDLKSHAVIVHTGLMSAREWRFPQGSGLSSVELHAGLEVNDATVALDAAEAGHGITAALSYMVSNALKEGRLVTVLDALQPPAEPVHIVYPSARLVAPKVRAFVDHVAPRLQTALENLALQGEPAAVAAGLARRSTALPRTSRPKTRSRSGRAGSRS